MNCTGCGEYVEPTEFASWDTAKAMDAEHCDNCNDRFYRAMAREYPYGQCPECGAAGGMYRCVFGVDHLVFNHAEGGCRYWSDRDGESECDLGCSRAIPFSYTPASGFEFDMDNLPF